MRQRERGSAILVTMLIIAALMAGAGILLSLQLRSSRTSDFTRSGTAALYCAEAGIAAARNVVAQSYSGWNGNMCTNPDPMLCTEPDWLATGIGSHDIDGDGDADFVVYLRDNDDDANGTIDNDLQVFVVSRCLAFPDTPKQVEELVLHNGAPPCMPFQQGGGNGDGNNNGC
jgi:hypothetical protein